MSKSSVSENDGRIGRDTFRRALGVAWLATGAALLAPAAVSAQQAELTVLEGARVIDGVSAAPIEDAVLVLEGRTVRALGARGEVEVPADATRVDLSGTTIMPGIFNLHGHVGRRSGMDYDPQFYTYETTHRDANAYLYFGVVHAASLGQDWPPMSDFVRDQRAGKVGGARLYHGGFGFTIDGGFQSQNPLTHKPQTPEEARRIVQRKAHEMPVDLVKMWVGNPGQPSIEPEIYEAVIDEARRQGLRSFVHAYQVEPGRGYLRAGISVLAHIGQDEPLDEEYVRLAVESGATQVPNLISLLRDANYLEAGFLEHPGLRVMFPDVIDIIHSDEYIEQRTARLQDAPDDVLEIIEQAVTNVMELHRAGVPMGIGSDSGSPGAFQGIWEHREMELLVRAGLTPMEVIQAATINGARAMGVDLLYGSLEPGKAADFIVLGSNPLDDIRNTLDIEAVWMDGREIDRDALAPEVEASARR